MGYLLSSFELDSTKMTKTMSNETFSELMQSVKEGAKILHGELQPASEFVHFGTDVKAIREKIGLSQ